MGALQPVLTTLLAPSAWPVPWSALDLVAIALAVWMGWAGRMAPGRARALLLAGVVVAGIGPVLASIPPQMPADGELAVSAVASRAAASAPGACAVLGLLLVAAGCARLEFRAGGARRRASLAEAFWLIVAAAGCVVALLAASAPNGASLFGEPTLPRTSVAAGAWAVALAGTVGVVAADTSGRASGPVPYRRRVIVVLAAGVYAAIVAASTALGVWTSSAPDGLASLLAFLAHPARDAALLLLAWSVRGVLDRPAAADYWREDRAAPGRGQRHVRRRHITAARSPHIVPTPPTTSSPPVRNVPGGIAWQATLAGASAPFTPPALRRSLLLQSAGATASASADGSGSRMSTPMQVSARALGALSADTLADGDTNRLGPAALDANLAPQAALSPQFVAALLHLQAEMLRAGRAYSFEELVALFQDVQPRSSLAYRHDRPPRVAQLVSELGSAFAPEHAAPATPAPLPGDDFTAPSPSRR